MESIYEEGVNILVANLRTYIAKAKRGGVVGMSKGNLKQCVSTRGLRIAPSAFNSAFEDAVNKVSVRDFEIY